MAIRDSWATQAAGPTGILDVEESRLAIAALVMPHTSSIKAKSGFRPGPTSPGLVTATGTPDGFVHVAPFQLLLQGGRSAAPGVYLACADAIVDINILSIPADPTNPRNDLIVARQSDTFYGDGTSPFEVIRIAGTPAGVPADPAIPGSGDHVTLARVRVDAAATTIVSGKITDLRTSGHAKSLTGGLYSVALGGILPVASAAERNALTGTYDGLPVWRQDLKRAEVYNGTAYQAISPYQSKQTLSGAAASVVFSSIPSSLHSLRIIWTARSNDASNSTGILLRINADTGANYDYQNIQAAAAAAPATTNAAAATSISLGALIAANSGAGIFSSGDVAIEGWDQPHNDHLGITFLGQAMRITTTGNVSTWGGGVYRGAGPYTSVTLLPLNGSFITGSEFVLQGWE